MRVPLADLARLHAPIRSELDRAIAHVLDSGRFILGPEVEHLEHAVAALSGRAHAIGVSSGTDALLATLMAIGVGPGDEVITPAFSFFAAAEAIARLGATPIFADIDADFTIDPASVASLVGPRTRAVVLVDLFGRRQPMDALAALGIPLIEDAAQAIGAPGLGTGVLAATLSFFPTKNLGALGDGGMVLTDDAPLAAALRLLRQHGARPKYVHQVVGGNLRLDALQAALLSAKLPHLRRWNDARREHAGRYRSGLAGLAGLGLPRDAAGHVWHQFVVRVDPGCRRPRRDALRAHLAEQGVETEVYYPLALHLQPCFAHLAAREGDLPRAEAATREVLALPIHPALDPAEIDHVVTSVRAFFAAA